MSTDFELNEENEKGSTDPKPATDRAPRSDSRAPREEREPRSGRGRDDRDDDAPRGKFTIADFGRSVNVRPTSGGLNDAALTALQNAFEKNKTFDKPSVPEAIKRDKFQLIPMDGAIARSSLSSLLLTLPTQIGATAYVLVYILTVDSTGPVQTRQQTDRNDTFDALVLPEDQLSTKPYKQAIKDQVQGVSRGAKVVVIGSQVLLSSVLSKLANSNDESNPVVDRVFDNAIDALCGVRQNMIDKASGSRSSDQRLNPDMLEKGSRLETTWDNSGRPGEDSSGLPVRSDVTASLYYSESSREDDERFDRTAMGELRAGIDLVLVDEKSEDRSPRFSSRRRSRDEDLQPFLQAVMNITSITAAPGFPFSLELALLLLAQAANQTNDYRWAAPLRPRSAIASANMGTMETISHIENLMLLNPDPDLRRVTDDITQNMSDEDLGDYLEITVRPKLAIGMTIPSSGEKAWVLSVFEKIATSEDQDEVDKLIVTLFDAADVLTGKRFRREYKDLTGGLTELPVESMGTRQFIGTWVDQKGNLRDLREWNVPALLTALGERGVNDVLDYQYTFEDARRSIDYNLSERYRILNRSVPNLHITGTAEVLGFNADFIEALSIALDKADMSSQLTAADGLAPRRNVGNARYASLSTADIGRERRRGSDRGTSRSRGRSIFGDDNGY